jgi:hypothetical protein
MCLRSKCHVGAVGKVASGRIRTLTMGCRDILTLGTGEMNYLMHNIMGNRSRRPVATAPDDFDSRPVPAKTGVDLNKDRECRFPVQESGLYTYNAVIPILGPTKVPTCWQFAVDT